MNGSGSARCGAMWWMTFFSTLASWTRPDAALRQVAQPAVQQAARTAAGAEGKVVLLDQPDPQPAHRRIPGDARADDAAADDQHVQGRLLPVSAVRCRAARQGRDCPSVGRARHSVRAVTCKPPSERRARSDTPYRRWSNRASRATPHHALRNAGGALGRPGHRRRHRRSRHRPRRRDARAAGRPGRANPTSPPAPAAVAAVCCTAALRYLAQGRIGLVWEASHEKKPPPQIAPHLAEPLAFLFPTYSNTALGPVARRSSG